MRHLWGYLNLFPISCLIFEKINIFFNIITKKVWINLYYLFASFEITSIRLRLFLHEPNKNCDQSLNIFRQVDSQMVQNVHTEYQQNTTKLQCGYKCNTNDIYKCTITILKQYLNWSLYFKRLHFCTTNEINFQQ